MFEVKQYFDRQYKAFELKDSEYGSYFRCIPQRGGIITGFGADKEEFLFMDEDTLYNENKKVHGGIPVLFPICGTLKNDEYTHRGSQYSMNGHGIARDNPWQVIETGTEGSAFIKLTFKSSELTKKSYLFDFQVIFTYSLIGRTLTIKQEYVNLSHCSMPMYGGFHPYFCISDKKRLKYDIDASLYIEIQNGNIKDYTGWIDMTNERFAKIFIDSKCRQASLYDEGFKRKITLEYSDAFKYIVIWSQLDKDFVCIEPWMAKPDSMNSKEDLHMIEPMDKLEAHFRIMIS